MRARGSLADALGVEVPKEVVPEGKWILAKMNRETHEKREKIIF